MFASRWTSTWGIHIAAPLKKSAEIPFLPNIKSTYVHTHTHTHTVCVQTQAGTHTHTVWTDSGTHTHTHTHTQCVQTHTHARTHTHTHAHTHTHSVYRLRHKHRHPHPPTCSSLCCRSCTWPCKSDRGVSAWLLSSSTPAFTGFLLVTCTASISSHASWSHHNTSRQTASHTSLAPRLVVQW